MNQISLNDISVNYGDVIALDNISLEVNRGDFISILGESGSGKTTLLKLMAGFILPCSGNIAINGKSTETFDEKAWCEFRKNHVGFVYQNYNLLAGLTVYQNIELPLLVGNIPKDERILRINNLLKNMDLLEKKDKFPHELSGGQQQRVSISRALVTNPDIIFADEPTGNLDTRISKDIIRIFREINIKNKNTVILVTHQVDLVKMTDRTIRIKEGKIVK